MELEDHLFRREAGRMVSVLTRLFGVRHLALAEDVVQDAFRQALETWKFRGVPDDPSAWLMTTAKNRALDLLRRERTARRFAPDLALRLESEWTLAPVVDEVFDAGGLRDSQLRMMFSCVHPHLPEETQVALVLHLLCGFGIDETAAAFLKNAAAMEKRLVRAKKTLSASRDLFDLRGAGDVAARLPSVLRALYLLFNEGYHGASPEAAVRAGLCDEALRLTGLLLENPLTATPEAQALAALFHFLRARLPSRLDEAGELTLLADQDRSRWDRQHLALGRRLLELSARGDALTAFHLEAGIAALHGEADSLESTDWKGIVSLYDALLRLDGSPVIALNRAVALAQCHGAARGLEEIERIAGRERLLGYPFYYTALGELELRLGHSEAATGWFEAALSRARNRAEKRFLETRLAAARRS
jgi:RNA polymerase sigma-70 factor (ECF subfamily)